MSTSTLPTHPETLTEDLRGTIVRDIRSPIAALRATLEALQAELIGSPEASNLVSGAVEQLIAIDRRSEALLELVLPSPLRPLACTVGEIVRSAWSALPAPRRQRVWLAIEDAARPVHVDGPVLVRSLSSLLEDATDSAGTEVLLHAHEQDDEVTFAIVDDLESCSVTLPRPGRASEESLPVRLARRDVLRMGGELQVGELTDQHRLTVVRVQVAAGGSA